MRTQGRRELVRLTEELVTEFDGLLPAGSVVRCVVRSRDQLLRIGIRDGLEIAVEAMARRRLLDRLPTRQADRAPACASPSPVLSVAAHRETSAC
jgi:hypothetical protein